MSKQTDDSNGLSRRSILSKTTAAGAALAVGGAATGSVMADQEDGRFNDSPGHGGQSVLPEEDFRANQDFVITGRTGDSAAEISGIKFQCNKGNGNSIFLVGWFFEYTDSDEQYVLYTRSNNVEVGETFTWGGRAGKVCKNGVTSIEQGDVVIQDGVQASYQVTGDSSGKSNNGKKK